MIYSFARSDQSDVDAFEIINWGTGTGYAKAFRVKWTDEHTPGVWTGYIGRQGFFMHEMHGAGESGTEDGPNWWDANGPYIQYDLQSDAGTGCHEYIVAIKTQSGVMVSDGMLQAYRDGVLLGERTGQHFLGYDADCTEAWNGAMLQPYFQLNGTASDGGLMWIDDYSMDNTWRSFIRNLYSAPDEVMAKGSRKNNFTFLSTDAFRLTALRKLDMSRYYCAFAPCQAGTSTLKNVNLFLREP